MTDTDHKPPPRLFLQALRQHVRAPLDTADQIVEREHTETTAERDAFETFAKRITTIDTGRATTNPGHATAARRTATADQMDRVRTAYRETVMRVPHYDAVYGESLADNVAAEFREDLAADLRADSPMSLTPPYKNALRAAAMQTVQERQAFLDALDREAQAITTARTELTDLLTSIDTTAIPDWHRQTFTDRLDPIAHDRQDNLGTRPALPRHDGHSLCEYLYQTEPWTYPVLTAVTRLREAVVL